MRLPPARKPSKPTEGFIIAPDYLKSGQVTFIKPEINMVTEIEAGRSDDLDQ